MKKKLILFEFLSVVTMLLPLTIFFIKNVKRYLNNFSPLGLSLAGIMCVIFAIVMVKDRFNIDNKVCKFLLIFIFCYMFEPLLKDLKMISLMAFLGVLANSLFFEYRIKNLRTLISTKNNIDILRKSGEDGNK